MAQIVLHQIPRRRLSGILLGLGLAVWMPTGCLMSSDIEPRDESAISPRLMPLTPYVKVLVIQVTREDFIDEIDLSAALYDGNDHRELRYLFRSDERGDPRVARAPLNGKRGDEYDFGAVKLSVNPCTGDITIPGTEVITLFVSDRGFFATSPNPQEIVPVEGSIMVAYSWTLKYEAGICDPDF